MPETDADIAHQLAFATDSIRNESRWLMDQAKRVCEQMDRAHPVMSEAWKRMRRLEQALKPFAAIALVRDAEPDRVEDMIDTPDLSITPNDVRRAREVLGIQ